MTEVSFSGINPMEDTIMIAIGDISIFNVKVNNPYKEARLSFEGKSDTHLSGDVRAWALNALKAGTLPDTFDVWHTPASGGASRVTAQQIFE